MGSHPPAWGLSGFLALVEELASPENCFSHTPQISAQWWSQSFSLKYMNTMTVIVKSMWTKLLPTNLHSFIERASLRSIDKTNKQNTDIQNEVTSAKVCSRGSVEL